MTNESVKTPRRLLRILLILSAHALLLFLAACDEADKLFNGLTLQEIHLTMKPDDWQALRDHYLDSTEYPADFRWGDYVITDVGVHSRGEGSRSGTKPNLKISFNKYAKDQQLLGLKAIILKNNVQDPTQMKERLAMALYREAGIPAPREAHARLYVNEEYRGLFAIVEDVDKTFLQAHFGQNTGNFFSYKWADYYYFTWKGSNPQLYIPSPFEPKSDTSKLDPNGLINFIDAINNESDATFVDTISQYIDVNQFLAHIAVSNATADTDSIVGDWGANNFFLYQSDNSTLFTFIPWDKDTAFWYIRWNIFNHMDRVVLTKRLLNFPELRTRYLDYMEQTAKKWVNGRWLKPRLEFVYNQIREAALADPYKPDTNEEFEQNVQALRAFTIYREEDILGQVQAQR